MVVVLLLLTATQPDLRLPHLFLPLFFPLPPTSLHILPTLPTSILHLLSSSRWSTFLVPLCYPACSSVGCHCFSPPHTQHYSIHTHRSCLCSPAFTFDHYLVSHHHFLWLDLSLTTEYKFTTLHTELPCFGSFLPSCSSSRIYSIQNVAKVPMLLLLQILPR